MNKKCFECFISSLEFLDAPYIHGYENGNIQNTFMMMKEKGAPIIQNDKGELDADPNYLFTREEIINAALDKSGIIFKWRKKH